LPALRDIGLLEQGIDSREIKFVANGSKLKAAWKNRVVGDADINHYNRIRLKGATG
jgi:hypothetical protein